MYIKHKEINSCGPRAVQIYKFLLSGALYVVIMNCEIEKSVTGVREQPDISMEA